MTSLTTCSARSFWSSSCPEPDHYGLAGIKLQSSVGTPSVYFIYTLLQSLDRDADLDDPNSIDELRVVGAAVVTQMMTANNVIQVFSISNKLLGTRTMWHRTVNLIGLGSLRTLLKSLCPICQCTNQASSTPFPRHWNADQKLPAVFCGRPYRTLREIEQYEDRDFAGIDLRRVVDHNVYAASYILKSWYLNWRYIAPHANKKNTN